MTLTLGSGPFSENGGGSVNFSLDDAPSHRLLFEDYPRRVRALVGGHTVLDSTGGKLLFETGIGPVYYLPVEDLDGDALEESDHTTHCPVKGDASYWHLRVGDHTVENAVWLYREPLATAGWLEGYCSLYTDAVDLWLHEDEPVRGHLRDPYHRVDVLESSRRVTVKAGGETVAESDRPKMLFETGLAPRPYLLRADVLPGILSPSEKTTTCPYKGEASYWDLWVGDECFEDAAWSYEAPLTESLKVGGHLCFDGEGIELSVT
jgi:uncharacterized protein (DUF427 family)